MHVQRATGMAGLLLLLHVQIHACDLKPIMRFGDATRYQQDFLVPNGLLIRAARSGDVDQVDKLCMKGISVDACVGREKTTPLMLAAQRGDGVFCQKLLECGANVKLTDRAGDAALMYAAKGGRFASKTEAERASVAQLLLEHGADPWQKNQQQSSPTQYVLLSRKIGLARAFLQHESVRKSKTQLSEVLLLLVACCYTDTVCLLLEHGADACFTDANGEMVLNRVQMEITRRGRTGRRRWQELAIILAGHVAKQQKKTEQVLYGTVQDLPKDLARCIAQFAYYVPQSVIAKRN